MEKIYPTCAVRYGFMGYIGEFRYAPGMLFGCGQKVVIQSNRGIEIGEQVSLTCTGCDKSVSRQQMMRYVKASGSEYLRLKAGRILRAASDQDLAEEQKLNEEAEREMARSRELIAEQGVSMKLVRCEHLFGGERVIFHFMSEERVDFRELVRSLAHEFHTRIEMHQVGSRDEARLVADYEICGRECCCRNFLKKLRPVAMRMAKLQKATLDPSKVSGRCGRLRCCLRYEQEGYEVMNRNLPKNGARIRTASGVATVINRQVLTQLLTVVYDNTDRETIALEEVLERGLPRRTDFGSRPAPTRPGRRGERAPATPDRQARGRRPKDRPRDTDAPPPAPEGGPPAEPPLPGGQKKRTQTPRRGDTLKGSGTPGAASGAGAGRKQGGDASEGQPERRRGRRRRRRGRRQQGGSDTPGSKPGDGHEPPSEGR
ncbi:MAG: stage 0 sporulation family protein [Phycisphaerae bacterium]